MKRLITSLAISVSLLGSASAHSPFDSCQDERDIWDEIYIEYKERQLRNQYRSDLYLKSQKQKEKIKKCERAHVEYHNLHGAYCIESSWEQRNYGRCTHTRNSRR